MSLIIRTKLNNFISGVQILCNTIINNFYITTLTWLVHRLSKASTHSLTPVRAPQRLSKATRLATTLQAPQRLLKASTHLATPVPTPQRLSKASTCLAATVYAVQRLLKASTCLATHRSSSAVTLGV